MLNKLSGVQAMLIAALFFSLMNLCVKLVPRLPAHEIVFFRSLSMFVICLVLLRARRIPLEGQQKRDLFLRGFFGTCGLLAYFYTLQNMPLASAVTLQYLNPIFSTFLALFLLKENVFPLQWLFFACSFVGVFMVKGFDPRVSLPFLALGLLSAFFSGLAYNYVRKLRGGDHPLVVIFYFSWLTLALAGPYTLMHWVWPQGLEWIWLLLVGLTTYIAQVLMTYAYQSDRMAVIANLNYTGLVYALILGWIILKEPVLPLSLAGMLLIVLGVVSGNLYAKKQSARIALANQSKA